jgi:hypothetical protein
MEELKKINMVSIMDEVGQLPETYLHCAQLAEITLKRSVENYMSRQQAKADSVDTQVNR